MLHFKLVCIRDYRYSTGSGSLVLCSRPVLFLPTCYVNFPRRHDNVSHLVMLGMSSSASTGKVAVVAQLSMPLSACTADQINHRDGDEQVPLLPSRPHRSHRHTLALALALALALTICVLTRTNSEL